MKLLIFGVILIATHTGAQDLEKRPVCYTQWFDRDNPNGNGDYETMNELRAEYPKKICSKPLTIQAATLTGVPAESIGQVFEVYDTVFGFSCVNSDQKNDECCLDYKVRFGCRCPWPPIKPEVE
ncbi:cartilage intermediate layer protein 1-like isoform X1 [Ictalurus punctatus]|uniref:Cartilage intermediate layer protein 1-like isoform X1 n=1 Tax=Ictalurus punctatus TaxID=7998 RepID=A0A9F7RKS3_ICTPU|nr:cartilage intermediate layer protein 1-like isoform X1 [Ictalurus punctatus]XP_053537084.1 cartilage intermediate layer protein 1-like isoform X1 [Ictalurus punctatus]XP_053537085.1 cartilage intermediate layer protein 1-like isoform X1 [Ictalurus punctatus]